MWIVIIEIQILRVRYPPTLKINQKLFFNNKIYEAKKQEYRYFKQRIALEIGWTWLRRENIKREIEFSSNSDTKSCHKN